jgi:hypothetical protein
VSQGSLFTRAMARDGSHLAGDRLPAQPELIEKALPELDRWWLIFVSLAAGGVLGWFSKINLFEGLIPVLVGRIVTSLLVGGGSQIVHTVVNKARDPLAGVFEV